MLRRLYSVPGIVNSACISQHDKGGLSPELSRDGFLQFSALQMARYLTFSRAKRRKLRHIRAKETNEREPTQVAVSDDENRTIFVFD